MSGLTKRQEFAPRCPQGGQWYACSSAPFFVGCCTRNPCGTASSDSSMCTQGNVRPGSFDANYYSQFPDASCESGSNFYTCIYSPSSNFLGCCKSNPCSQGACPANDLTPAFLGREDQKSAYISGYASSSTATSATSTVTSSATGTALPAGQAHKTNTTGIAVGAACGALGLALIIGIVVWLFRRHAEKSRNTHTDELTRRMSDLPAKMAEKDKVHGHSDAPPGYTSPNPNLYYTQNPAHYATYAHTQQPYNPPPQELPIEPLSPLPYTRKPVPSHRRNLSELSGDTAVRSELSSPTPSPMFKQGAFGPASPQLVIPQASPLTPQSATFTQQAHGQTKSAGQTEDAVEQWMAYQERLGGTNTMGESHRYESGQVQGGAEGTGHRTSAFQEQGLHRGGPRG